MVVQTNSDGGSRGNPGIGAIGIVVRREGEILKKFGKKIGDNVTNNIAEYEAIIKALEIASEYDSEVECYLDSELVVNQLLGKYQVKNKKLMELFLRVQKVQERFDKVKYIHVSRWDEWQRIADDILNKELDKK